jgi:hypothetical protein
MELIEEMVSVLKAACDRNWSDETPLQVATIAANAIYWRDREIATLRADLTGAADHVRDTLDALKAMRR